MDPENPQAPVAAASPGRKSPRRRKKATTRARKTTAGKGSKARPRKSAKTKKAGKGSRVRGGIAAAGRIGRQTRKAVASTTAAASKRIGRALREEREKGFPKTKAVIVVGGIILDVALIAREMMRPGKSNTNVAQKALDVIGKRLR